MSSRSRRPPLETPDATAAVAQSRPPPGPGAPPDSAEACAGERVAFEVDPSVCRVHYLPAYVRREGDPLFRPLRIYTLDPSRSRLEGSVATVNVPYEELRPGPVGALFEIGGEDEAEPRRYRAVDLDAPRLLIQEGVEPSPGDPRFHQQMLYVVGSTVCAAFQKALGRHLNWGFEPQGEARRTRLRVRPHAPAGSNAYYDRERGELVFGYYRASAAAGGSNLPCSTVFTCLSHDIVAHEVTHALVDGLRANFAVPTGPDVLAFHEGFADLVAIFQRFSYSGVVNAAIRESRGKLPRARLLTGVAWQLGQTRRAADTPQRTAVVLDEAGQIAVERYDASLEPHALGSVLVSAVFEAFNTVYDRKVARYVRLATSGSGVLPQAELSRDLQEVLAEEARQLAGQFLTMCVRAIDYLPPVDVLLGDFLRAVITADYDLVPDDPWAYREAWIEAFRRRGIYPQDVRSLSEDELRWRAPEWRFAPVRGLSFADLRFSGDPASPADAAELRRQACCLGQLFRDPAVLAHFGMAPPGGRADGTRVGLPRIHSIRSSRRVGPNGQVVFDQVAEVSQWRTARLNGREVRLLGGATLIMSPEGELRYIIGKGVLSGRREEEQRRFMAGDGRGYWEKHDGRLEPRRALFAMLHEPPRSGDGTGGGR